MYDAGIKLALHIDNLVKSKCETYQDGRLHHALQNQMGTIGRLLYYYPAQSSDNEWCGWHNDHSAITCLTSSIFQDKDGNIVECTDPQTGLYAKNRFSEICKIKIPQDYMAVQIGETAQILTGGILEATPHCVVSGKAMVGTGISRTSFPVFIGPRDPEPMRVPDGIDPNTVYHKDAHKIPPLQDRWNPNDDTFYTFCEKTIKKYYY